jgi:putative lipoic acid-binding regulatory protein
VTDERKPQLEYPCAYPIKVMGLDENDFAAHVVTIVRRHDGTLREEDISFRASSNGKYLSVRVVITATGPEHIQALFEELKASGRVAMVL